MDAQSREVVLELLVSLAGGRPPTVFYEGKLGHSTVSLFLKSDRTSLIPMGKVRSRLVQQLKAGGLKIIERPGQNLEDVRVPRDSLQRERSQGELTNV